MTALSDMAFLGKYFEEFSDRLQKAIQCRLDSRLAQRVGAEEILQEIFLRVKSKYENNPIACRIEEFWWWHCIAKDLIIEQYRKHAGTQRGLECELTLPSHVSGVICQRLSAASTPSQNVANKELQEKIHHAIARLNDDQRNLILMRFFEGMTYKEIGLSFKVNEDKARRMCGAAVLAISDDFGDESNF